MCIENHQIPIWNIDSFVNGDDDDDESIIIPIKYNNKKSKPTTYSIKKVLKAIFKKNQETRKKEKQYKITAIDNVTKTSKILSTSLESLENLRNSKVEQHYEEIEENTANEKLLSYIYDEFVGQQNISNHYHQAQQKKQQKQQQQQQQQQEKNQHKNNPKICLRSNERDSNKNDENCSDDVFVPVRYARTEAGTFFWTTNLRIIDTDHVQPVYCTTTNNRQFSIMQFQLQDRWAQA